VRRALPRADILVHAEPVVGVREKLSDKVEWLVRQSALTAHNIAILWVDEAYVIEFDIEYPQGTSFEEAHELATEVEVRIREHIANVRYVHIHLEEDTVSALNARDISTDEAPLLRQCAEYLDAQEMVRDVGMLRLFSTEDGLRLSVTISLPPGLSLSEMHHVVDHLETGLSAIDARIDDVFIHAEPADQA
jgi:divalent metal cation (Fe/Co/Zn/Cd) transporter